MHLNTVCCTLHCADLSSDLQSLCLQVQLVKSCWEFPAPKEMMASQDSQGYPDPRDSLERWVHQVFVTAAEAATELHSNQVCAWKNISSVLVSQRHCPWYIFWRYYILLSEIRSNTQVIFQLWIFSCYNFEQIGQIFWKGSFVLTSVCVCSLDEENPYYGYQS